jgi:hypothetical protein
MQNDSLRAETAKAAKTSRTSQTSNATQRRRWTAGIVGAIAVAAGVAGWAYRAPSPEPIAAPAPVARETKPQPRVLSAMKPIGRAAISAQATVATAEKVDDDADRENQLVVVPDPANTIHKVIWTKELDGVSATLMDNGIIGYSRKLEADEKPLPGDAWPPKAAAAIGRLVAEAREYSKANLVTMPRRDYEQMVAAEEDERAVREAEHEAEIQAQLDKEGVPEAARHSSTLIEGEAPKFN